MSNRLLGVGVLLVFVGFLATGCVFVKLKQEVQESLSSTVIVGHVSTESAVDGPIIVAAYTKNKGKREVEHYTILHDRGEFELMVKKGKFYIFAYIDSNSNLIYDEGELAGQFGEPKKIVAPAGGVVPNINIVIPESGKVIDWHYGHPITTDKPKKLYSRLAGTIANLDDERFDDENGSLGFWEPLSFYKTFGGTIYFLEEYDPEKIPILFVHGAGGTPKGWKFFIDNLDRTRFQPWFFYYPTGARMRSMSNLLMWKLQNLQIKYKFDKMVITAHSMGGLVARSFIMDHSLEFPYVKLFVSLATPWGGDKMAEYGVKQAPAVIPCWIDMQPEGDFIKSLYQKRMPDEVDFYMFYGHRGNRNPFRSNNDGTIPLSSLLDRRPQAEAKMSYAFDEDHASIAYSKEVLEQYNMILNSFVAEQSDSAFTTGGYIQLNFTYDYPADSGRPWPKLVLRTTGKQQKESEVALRPEDNGRRLGPFPSGDYLASIFAEGVKPIKNRVPVSVESNTTNELNFSFIPDGTLTVYVTTAIKAENKAVGMPGWQDRPQDNTIVMQSIALEGNGVRRTFQPVDLEKFNWREMETSRTDYLYNGYLRVFGLPAGEYELVIKAEGHKNLVTKVLVTPGRESSTLFYELTPKT
jgi:pimeloyl-ACP methyl ester carboxylesterase